MAELRVPRVGPRGCVGWGLHCYGRTGTAKFPCRGGGRGTRGWLGASVGVPELGRSPQFKLSMLYAGDTWLEETEETSVLLWDTVEEVSSSPKGFLPQQIVVIMQLRNWGGERNDNGGTGGQWGRATGPGVPGWTEILLARSNVPVEPPAVGVSPVCS